MFSFDFAQTREIFSGIILVLSAWLFLCVAWITLTNHAEIPLDARSAARQLLGTDQKYLVKNQQQAITIINAMATSYAAR